MGKGEITRQAILERATALASRSGLEGLSIGHLAEELGLSKSGLFAHFDSKEDLQVQVLDRAAERFADVVVRPALAVPAGEARLRALFESWLAWPRRVKQPGGCVFMAAAAELDDRPGPARDRLVALEKEWLATIAQVFRSGQAAGAFRRELDPAQVAFEFMGIAMSCHFAARLLRDPRAVERARAALERLVLDARLRS